MSNDAFEFTADGAAHPARQAFAIAPHDSQELAILPKALLIGAGGVLVTRAVDSVADVSIPVVAGQILPLRAQFVRATGTTAGAIVGLA